MTQRTAAIVDELDDTQLHLLLAASAQENLLIGLQDFTSLSNLISGIRSFCDATSIARSVHFVPPNLFEQAKDLEEVLEHFFLTEQDQRDDNVHIGEVPQTLVIPLIEGFASHIYVGLKSILRDRRFILKEHVYNLPNDFLVVGIVNDWSALPHYMVDAFGLSLELDRATQQATTAILPPLIPLSPPACYTPKLRLYAADVLSAIRLHPLVQNTLLTARCNYSYLIKIATLWVRLKTYNERIEPEHLFEATEKSDKFTIYARDVDVRPNDIADVLATCIMHRLRVRPAELRWHRFWNKDPPTLEASKAEEALREGVKPDFSGIIETVLARV